VTRRWLVVLGATVLVIAVVAGVFVLWFGPAAHHTFAPTAAELNRPDRAAKLIGSWIYLGSILMEDGKFMPPPTRLVRTFSPDGTERGSYVMKGEDMHWEIDSQGRLHEWATNAVDETYGQFFFRNSKLYVEGDSAWEEYQRR
jgi:hypothetical protein